MRTIEQTASRGTCQRDSVRIGCKSLPRDLVTDMEDPRCRVAAVESEDLRCKFLLQGMEIEVEDLRCRNLGYNRAVGMEDPRCNRVAMVMDDPRCQCLRDWY